MTTTAKVFQNYIGGRWQDAHSGQIFPNCNPATRGTGNGHHEAGIAGLDVFTEWKVVYTDFSGKLQKAQIDE